MKKCSVLTRLDLRFFKCFERLQLPLAPLTLLAGLNASGKSSALQALVLLHQTMREHEWTTRLVLNGTGVRLGTMPNVVDEVFGRSSFEIALLDDENTCGWTFAGDRRDMSMAVKRVSVNGQTVEAPQFLRYLLPSDEESATSPTSLARKLRDLTYITAERVGPQDAYSLEDPHFSKIVGPRGEHAVSVLHSGQDKPVLADLALPDAPASRFRQVEQRMRTFFPGCTLELQQAPRSNVVTLGLRTSEDTGFHLPAHTGYGLTQCLPIVVAALSADRGDILLIENPEIHLHPAGQAMMGQFLADVARAGMQVLVETHSDHVLSGIRRKVKKGHLAANQVAIHFFRPRSEDQPQVVSPTIDESGNIDFWPEGFFDQFDKDTSYFAGWGESGS